MTNVRLGIGNVEISLIDPSTGEARTLALKPSLHAVRTLSRKYGGLEPIVQKIKVLDFDTVVDVLFVGLQLPMGDPKKWQELENSVYLTGLSDSTGGLPSLAVRFITHLIHGGRPPPEAPAGQSAPANPPKAE